MAETYGAAIVFANVKGFAHDAEIRVHWSTPMAAEIPPVFVSLSLPDHLVDVPMVETASARTQPPAR
jgi:beta-N-acetylhexosaminidase